MNTTTVDTSVQDSFQEALKDVISITEKLSENCSTIQDLVEILKLALENKSQLRLIMSLMTPKKK